MSLTSRLLGFAQQIGVLRFVDQRVAPPTPAGDPTIYRIGDVVYFRDATGNVHPLVVGANGAGVHEVNAAASPYAVQPEDRVLLVDTTIGPVTLTLPAPDAALGLFEGRELTVVDAARSFGSNACTIDGNGNQVNASATLAVSTTGARVNLVYVLPTWQADYPLPAGAVSGTIGTSQLAADSVTGAKIAATAFRSLYAQGRNGQGAVVLTGAKVGDAVLKVENQSDGGGGEASFETVITVADQIQQSAAGDLSAKKYSFLLLAKS